MTFGPSQIGAIVQGGAGTAQAIGGFFTRRKAKREYDRAKMPDFMQSAAFDQAEQNANLAGRYAQEGLPESTKRLMEDQLGRTTAATIQGQDSLRGLGAVGLTASTLADQYRNIGSMDAQARIQQRQSYLNELGNFQAAKQQAFDYEMGDFLNKQAERLGRIAAGQQMFNQGLQNIADSGETFAGGGGFGNIGG